MRVAKKWVCLFFDMNTGLWVICKHENKPKI